MSNPLPPLSTEYEVKLILKHYKEFCTGVYQGIIDYDEAVAAHALQALIARELEQARSVNYKELERKLTDVLQDDPDFEFIVRQETVNRIMGLFVTSKLTLPNKTPKSSKKDLEV